MRSTVAKPEIASQVARWVATMSLGRPVLPPDVGALNEAGTSGGNGSGGVAGGVDTMSWGRPWRPPDVGALNEAATSGGNGSGDVAGSGSKPADTVARP